LSLCTYLCVCVYLEAWSGRFEKLEYGLAFDESLFCPIVFIYLF